MPSKNATATVKAPALNGRRIFYAGWLDQSFWPDGLYAAASDDALAFDLRAAKEASVVKALAALTKKLKSLDAKPKKGGGLMDTMLRRVMGQIDLTVSIRDVHIRVERLHGEGAGAPPFSAGFMLPSVDVKAVVSADTTEKHVAIQKAGIYVRAGQLHGENIAQTMVEMPPSSRAIISASLGMHRSMSFLCTSSGPPSSGRSS